MINDRPLLRAAVAYSAATARATLEYSDILITLCLCVKLAGPTKENVRRCAQRLAVRVTENHSIYRLNQIIQANDPYAVFLGFRREVNAINARIGLPADTFL